MHFCSVHFFSSSEKDILIEPCLKQHAFSVDTVGVLCDFCFFKTSFFYPKGRPKQEKRAHFLEPKFRNWAPNPPKMPHCDRKSGPECAHSKGPAHPVRSKRCLIVFDASAFALDQRKLALVRPLTTSRIPLLRILRGAPNYLNEASEQAARPWSTTKAMCHMP